MGLDGQGDAGNGYEDERERMLRQIEAEARYTRDAIGKDALDPRVLEALRRVPRHELVPYGSARLAYENRPLSIGCGQTISQPYIVALMTDLLALRPEDKVLEVGTGSGYQTAVLCELARQVYTIEIIPELHEHASRALKRLGYSNVETRLGDGYAGWPEHAPYGAIIVTAAAPEVPPPLIEQLAPGGRLVIPVGGPFFSQELMLLSKDAAGEVHTRHVLPVAFVPLTGDHTGA